jgi:transcriptional regulator with PAS, ATPase and Fis domain
VNVRDAPPGHDPTTHVATDHPAATMRVHAAQLEVIDGPDRGLHARVDRPRFVIGSGHAADLRLTDDTVSREHLRISLTPSGVQLKDEGSTNGTWIGSARIGDILLTSGTTIRVGSTTLALHVEAGPLDLPLSAGTTFGQAMGESAAMRHLFAVLERAAQTGATVLVEGESGVGKELLARGLHEQSARRAGPFVAVDCGAIAPGLIESELFGHERGAFTGADRARTGAFEAANGGTLFLDEVGELPVDLQPKLLRALEAREVRPVGSNARRQVDVRIIAATNRNLDDAASKGEFRRDLFYRLAVVRVIVPPLRDRPEDILPLARAMLRRIPSFERAEIPVDVEVMLARYTWPGNVRELRNVMERYALLGPNPAALFDASLEAPHTRTMADLSHLPFDEARRIAIDRFERAYLPAVLERAGGVVTRAAQLARVGRGSFYRMLQRIRGASEPPREE